MPLYKTTFTFSILTDRRVMASDMSDLAELIQDGWDGDSVWQNDLDKKEQMVSSEEMRRLLVQSGSDPDFFGSEEYVDEDPDDDEGAEDDPKAQFDEDPID